MKRMIARIMRYYGAPVTLEYGGEVVEIRAFLRPVTSKSWQSMRKAMSELGQIPEGQHLFLGPPECRLDMAQAVRCGARTYYVRRAEQLLVGCDTVCWWGLLEVGGPDDAGIA